MTLPVNSKKREVVTEGERWRPRMCSYLLVLTTWYFSRSNTEKKLNKMEGVLSKKGGCKKSFQFKFSQQILQVDE